jgi:hypothetical protein
MTRTEVVRQKSRQREHLVVIAHNRLPWFIARRLVRIVTFGDGTYMLGWRWSKKGWLVG